MKNLILFILFILPVSISAQASYNTNLVINGNASVGSLSGWDANSGSDFVEGDFGFTSPQGGNVFDFYTGSASPEWISQTIDVSNLSTDISTGTVKMVLSSYMLKGDISAPSSIICRLMLEQLDGSNSVVATAVVDNDVLNTVGPGDPSGGTWAQKTITVNGLNASTRKLRIKLYGELIGTTGSAFVEFDGINLQLTPMITFTDGSTFTQNITPNSSNQALACFRLTGAGSTLTAATIRLNNARTGLSNLKLWSSTDATFSSGSDIQLGSTIAADPGNGNSVTFSSLSSSIGTSGTYYFITGDVSASPTGTVQGVVVQNSSLTISVGTLTGTITNAVLSSNAAALPVELTSFTVSTTGNKSTLHWNTATEMNNYGFDIERKSTGTWSTIGFIEGHGTTNTPQSYSYVDLSASGKVMYRLKQIDRDGKFEYSKEIEAIAVTPTEFSLSQNYPNPFNPSTVINYSIASASHVVLKVYDLLGKEIATLANGSMEPGKYTATFDASRLSSGVYFYRLEAGAYSDMKRLSIMK